MRAPRTATKPRRGQGRNLSDSDVERLREALLFSSYSYVAGSTHGFYHYPARFSPAIARAVIEVFSDPGDWILDPFMGGGTSVIEGLAMGRRVAGIDINTLAHFVTKVRTSPLSRSDERELHRWAKASSTRFGSGDITGIATVEIKNLPGAVKAFAAGALRECASLSTPKQKAFARCVLLRLGQWALDCRDIIAPRRRRLATKLPELTSAMISGLRDFVSQCRRAGIPMSVCLVIADCYAEALLVLRRTIGWQHSTESPNWSSLPRRTQASTYCTIGGNTEVVERRQRHTGSLALEMDALSPFTQGEAARRQVRRTTSA